MQTTKHLVPPHYHQHQHHHHHPHYFRGVAYEAIWLALRDRNRRVDWPTSPMHRKTECRVVAVGNNNNNNTVTVIYTQQTQYSHPSQDTVFFLVIVCRENKNKNPHGHEKKKKAESAAPSKVRPKQSIFPETPRVTTSDVFYRPKQQQQQPNM